MPRFRPLLFVLGFLIFWGASLTPADVSLRTAVAATQSDAAKVAAESEKLSRSSAWLDLCTVAADLADREELDFTPALLEGAAVSLHVPAGRAASVQVEERPADRRPATLVGTVVLMI